MRRKWLCAQTEQFRHLALGLRRQRERTAIERLSRPAAAQRELQARCAEGAPEVRPALAPVEAGAREASSRSSCGIDVEAQAFKRDGAIGREVV